VISESVLCDILNVRPILFTTIILVMKVGDEDCDFVEKIWNKRT
jgi:hypothetical protein